MFHLLFPASVDSPSLSSSRFRLADYHRERGHDFDGIIGAEFIQEFVVEIDYQGRLLKLHDKNNFTYQGTGQRIPIELEHGHPLLSAEVTPVDGKRLPGSFVLDLGSGLALALYSPFLERHGLPGSRVNDIILMLNGKPAKDLTLSTLNEMLEHPRPYRVTIQRGRQNVTGFAYSQTIDLKNHFPAP